MVATSDASVARCEPAPWLSDPLTWSQICERYPEQWVCLVEIDDHSDTDVGFRTARVATYGKDPRTPLADTGALRARYDELAHLFTGRPRALRPPPL